MKYNLYWGDMHTHVHGESMNKIESIFEDNNVALAIFYHFIDHLFRKSVYLVSVNYKTELILLYGSPIARI